MIGQERAGQAPASCPTPAEIAAGWLAERPLYLDTETTGFEPTAEVCEIAVMDDTGLQQFHTLIQPKAHISLGAYNTHGLTAADLDGAPTWPQVEPLLAKFLRGRLVLVYNLAFDMRMMQQSADAHGYTLLPLGARFECAMLLYAAFHGKRSTRLRAGKDRPAGFQWQSLANAAEQCKIAPGSAHRALADVWTLREIVHHMARKAPKPPTPPDAIQLSL